MKKDKEIWLNDVLGSFDGMASAEANPFLLTRIKSKLENHYYPPKYLGYKTLISMGSAIMILIGLNIFILKHSFLLPSNNIALLVHAYDLQGTDAVSQNF